MTATETARTNKKLMEGSEAMAEAAIAAGCRFFAGYPMTPFTELLEHFAKRLPDQGGVCINAESELEAVGMAWGALSTGARELPLAAASARVSATQAFDYASKENIQTHGGMGFTWAVDCHFYYKRSKELGLALGPQRAWKDKLVTELETSNA